MTKPRLAAYAITGLALAAAVWAYSPTPAEREVDRRFRSPGTTS